MLERYASIDSRVRTLGYIMKVFAKVTNISLTNIISMIMCSSVIENVKWRKNWFSTSLHFVVFSQLMEVWRSKYKLKGIFGIPSLCNWSILSNISINRIKLMNNFFNTYHPVTGRYAHVSLLAYHIVSFTYPLFDNKHKLLLNVYKQKYCSWYNVLGLSPVFIA